ncbi:MAG: hypothetical protein AB2556_24215, partial [Candidatus Thiodiazotropha sp.]
ELIDEILAEMPDPAAALDGEFSDAKEEFEVDGAAAVVSSWRVEEEDPFDIGDIEVADGIHARAGRLPLDARITDERAARLLDNLPEGGFLLKPKFFREQQEGEWAVRQIRLCPCGEGGDRPSLRSHDAQGLAC